MQDEMPWGRLGRRNALGMPSAAGMSADGAALLRKPPVSLRHHCNAHKAVSKLRLRISFSGLWAELSSFSLSLTTQRLRISCNASLSQLELKLHFVGLMLGVLEIKQDVSIKHRDHHTHDPA